jgi:peptidoglycan/xylan/chitin deacetylase (PgdA/CDA1 family)
MKFNLHFKLSLVILIYILLFSFNLYGNDKKPITLVFRYDDYSFNIKIEKFIVDVFNKYNLPITFGVVQGDNHLNNTDIEALKNTDKKKEVEIAMHGYAHSSTELFGTYDEQYKLLQKGKKFLEKSFNTRVVTFIPPYNRYSLNTLKVLNDLNFKVISSDKTGPFNNSKIVFLPCTSTLASLADDITKARKLKLNNCIIVVLFHHYDFYEDNETHGKISKSKFTSLIKWVSMQNDINVKTLGEASNLIGSNDFADYDKIHKNLYYFRYLPFDQHKYDLNFYPSVDFFKSLKEKLYLFFAIYHITVLIMLSILSYFVFYNFLSKRINLITILLIASTMFLEFVIPSRFLGSFLTLVLGTISGILLSNHKLKKKGFAINNSHYAKT